MTLPTLNIRTVTLHTVDYSDLENAVNALYSDRLRYEDCSWSPSGKRVLNEWSFVASEECGNDSEHQMTAQTPADLLSFEREELDAFRAGTLKDYMGRPLDWPGTQVVLSDLVGKGVIPAGDYLIRVCW